MSISQTYQHLNAQERAVIMLSHGAGFSVRAIARTLARSATPAATTTTLQAS